MRLVARSSNSVGANSLVRLMATSPQSLPPPSLGTLYGRAPYVGRSRCLSSDLPETRSRLADRSAPVSPASRKRCANWGDYDSPWFFGCLTASRGAHGVKPICKVLAIALSTTSMSPNGPIRKSFQRGRCLIRPCQRRTRSSAGLDPELCKRLRSARVRRVLSGDAA
jgi:hypothetical protein